MDVWLNAGLCLVGHSCVQRFGVMGRDLYGNGSHFLLRQLLWLALGLARHDGRHDFDYRKLRRPQLFSFSFWRARALAGVFFLDNRNGRIAGFNGPANCSPPNSPRSL